jgi:hypothetical protein
MGLVRAGVEELSPNAIPARMAIVRPAKQLPGKGQRVCRLDGLHAERRLLPSERCFVLGDEATFVVEAAHQRAAVPMVIEPNETGEDEVDRGCRPPFAKEMLARRVPALLDMRPEQRPLQVRNRRELVENSAEAGLVIGSRQRCR